MVTTCTRLMVSAAGFLMAPYIRLFVDFTFCDEGVDFFFFFHNLRPA